MRASVKILSIRMVKNLFYIHYAETNLPLFVNKWYFVGPYLQATVSTDIFTLQNLCASSPRWQLR